MWRICFVLNNPQTQVSKKMERREFLWRNHSKQIRQFANMGDDLICHASDEVDN